MKAISIGGTCPVARGAPQRGSTETSKGLGSEPKVLVRIGSLGERCCALLLWLFATLFAWRVAGQALQYWDAQAFLPPAHAFQGSKLPYWLLLPAQLAILAVMLRLAWRVQQRKLVPSRRTGRMLAWAGGAYMALSLTRIALGLVLPDAPAWFRAWIPALFHVVLSGFVLTLYRYHQRGSGRTDGEAWQ